jgi:hypothetical protein
MNVTRRRPFVSDGTAPNPRNPKENQRFEGQDGCLMWPVFEMCAYKCSRLGKVYNAKVVLKRTAQVSKILQMTPPSLAKNLDRENTHERL